MSIEMSGTLTLDALRDFVKVGEIDTILVVFPDMQGRLLGKRVTGHYFLDHGVEELHVCDYLLAMDMEPVPGYKAASWELGYGDFPLRPDLATLREALALLDESAVYCSAFGDDVVDHYLHTGRWEQAEYDRRITDWEVRRNFERG